MDVLLLAGYYSCLIYGLTAGTAIVFTFQFVAITTLCNRVVLVLELRQYALVTPLYCFF
jgi:hypothetical protein